MAQLKIAREQAEIAAAPARLNIGFVGGAARVQPAQTPVIQATIAGVEGSFQNDPNFAYNVLEATLTFRKLIYDGGLVATRIAAAKLGAQSTEYSALAQWRSLHLEIEASYLNVLQTAERIRNAEASRELALANLNTAEKRFAVGQVPRGDIVFAQVPLAQAELELERAAFEHQSAREALLLLLGIPQSTPVEVEEVTAPPPLPWTLEQALQMAMQQRYDLLATQIDVVSAEKTIKATKKEDDPRVALAARVDPVGFDGTNLASGGYRVGVQLEWPILNGNLVAHQVKVAQAQYDGRVALLEQKKQEVEREVREAYREVKLAEIARSSTALQLDQARESLRISQGQYSAGLAAFNVVNDQQRELVRAQGAQTQSTYNYLLARARLNQAVGSDVLAEFSVAPTN